MKTPHEHAALIKAWADGAQIEYLSKQYNEWITTNNPAWLLRDKYRIKPEPKPDVVEYIFAERIFCVLRLYEVIPSNLKLTFDGETGKLKTAEVIA